MKASNSKLFLIDGFPRKMDQALKFEEKVCGSKIVLFFDCSEEAMEQRIMKRGETSGRVDDNKEALIKRFQTFKETSFPVIEYYQKLNKVKRVLDELTRLNANKALNWFMRQPKRLFVVY